MLEIKICSFLVFCVWNFKIVLREKFVDGYDYNFEILFVK